jgi:hypothetical protein
MWRPATVTAMVYGNRTNPLQFWLVLAVAITGLTLVFTVLP